ncbi:hypothetical protein ACA910_001600 [Epithemia clementina (nom. ined.)]
MVLSKAVLHQETNNRRCEHDNDNDYDDDDDDVVVVLSKEKVPLTLTRQDTITLSSSTTTTVVGKLSDNDEDDDDDLLSMHKNDAPSSSLSSTETTLENVKATAGGASSSSLSTSSWWWWTLLFWQEVQLLLTLSLPSIMINLSFMVPHFLNASYIGRHFGPTHLVGYALAMVTANIFQGTLLQGLFNASDTLSPQAYGAQNYREVGLLALRGYVLSMVLVVIPMNGIMYVCMPDLLLWFGQDATAVQHGYQYFVLYSASFPFYTLVNILWKFLAAQTVLWPLVYATLICTFVLFPIGLQVLGHVLGFVGPAVATALFYLVQSILILILLWYFQPHDVETWPGCFNAAAWRDALWSWTPLSTYLSLGLGGILAMLEWVYWEALYLLIGTFGVVPLSAHTIPAAVSDILYMIPLGIGMALSIRMGHYISHNVAQTQALAVGTLFFGSILFGCMAILLYLFQSSITHMFTQDDQVLALCRVIWPNVCWNFFSLGIYAIVIGIAIGLGMQWTLGIVTVTALWGIGMPAAYYFALQRQGGLNAVWTWMWPCYVLISVAMCIAFLRTDWHEISRQVQEREGMQVGALDEQHRHGHHNNKHHQHHNDTTHKQRHGRKTKNRHKDEEEEEVDEENCDKSHNNSRPTNEGDDDDDDDDDMRNYGDVSKSCHSTKIDDNNNNNNDIKHRLLLRQATNHQRSRYEPLSRQQQLQYHHPNPKDPEDQEEEGQCCSLSSLEAMVGTNSSTTSADVADVEVDADAIMDPQQQQQQHHPQQQQQQQQQEGLLELGDLPWLFHYGI